MNKPGPLPWQIISSSRNHIYRIFNIRTDLARSPRTRKEHEFYILESAPWVNIIPLTSQNQVVLIRQYRHGIQANTLEIPGGLVETNDTPRSAAQRELQEETGYRAREIRYLGKVHPNPAIQNNECHTFLALQAQACCEQDLDEKEDIQVLLRPLQEIPGLILQSEITHSLVLAAFHLYFLQENGQLSPGKEKNGV
ncbi:MAG: NUDIX hydrolase [Thermodesulfobacteriota bacterium]